MHTDDAYDHLVHYLVGLPKLSPGDRPKPDDRPYGCEVWIPHAAWEYWRTRISDITSQPELGEEHYLPFYDAAWDLCRIGVLRPGEVAAKGMGARGFRGDGYSITTFGRSWLETASQRPVNDPSRLAQVLGTFAPRFGDGYAQRSAEAVRCYRTANYLAACVMAGAAAESILLAVAIKKSGAEETVLAEYRSSKGRRQVTKRVTANLAASIAQPLQIATHLISYWRDDTAHGRFTTIGEVEAHMSLGQLLRLAQTSSDNWDALTTCAVPSQ